MESLRSKCSAFWQQSRLEQLSSVRAMRANRKLPAGKIFVAHVLLVLFALGVSAHDCAKKPSDIELRITPGELVKGVPRTIGFVFLNITDHEERIPPLSPCIGQYSGTIQLRVDFSPVTPQTSGKGAGCGAGGSHPPGILEQAKSWRRLKPSESFAVSYERAELFDFEEAPGAYELWGEYRPPQLTTEEIAVLDHAGIAFPCRTLRSAHLQFNRPQ
jgi:hypothetical protein